MAIQNSGAPHALLSGGGTGGHVYPAVAVADELLARGWRVTFMGREASFESRVAIDRGLRFEPVRATALVGRSRWQRVATFGRLVRSGAYAAGFVRNEGVDVVFGTGSYVAAPAVIGGKLARKPALILEPNARGGVANRWLSRWTNEAIIASESAAADLRCPSRRLGVPVREEFARIASELPEGPLRVLVLGGSQGARQINELLPPAIGDLAARFPGLQVVHQTGEAKLEETRLAYATYSVDEGTVSIVPYLDDMAKAMASAHLVISRAGAVTLAEICAAGRPSILIPLTIAGGHQVSNARSLSEAGASILFEGTSTEDGSLADVLSSVFEDRVRLVSMALAARARALPRAAQDIADRLEHWSGRSGGAH